MQNRNRDTDVENKHMDTKGVEKGVGKNWETGNDVFTLLILSMKQVTNENLLYCTRNPTQCSLAT